MIESEEPIPAPDLGPPVLLKRLGNAVEANLAKAKLATAGIPSFLGGENVFAGNLIHPQPYREVEIYVPQSMVHDALDILETPVDFEADPFLADDPGKPLAFRAFVVAVIGWFVLFLGFIGPALGAIAFVSAIFLSIRALALSHDRPRVVVVQTILAILLSFAGLAFVAALALMALKLL